MSLLLLAIGAAILALVLWDSLWTTVVPAGAGPLTSTTSRLMWQAALRLPERLRAWLLPCMGSLILLTAIALWVTLLWLGWWLVFSADTGSVVSSTTQLPADGWERLYFVGFCAFTLGLGDFVPGSDLWRICTALASFSGLFLITLSITYLLPVLSAATQQRQLATLIHDLGETPASIVNNCWNGRDFSAFTEHLAQVWPLLALHNQRHASYPVLHYFRSRDRRTSVAVAVAVLYDALLLLREGVKEEHRPDTAKIRPVNTAIEGLLAMLRGKFISDAASPPTPPDLSELLPELRTGDSAFEASIARYQHTRRLLRGFIEESGWRWTDIAAPARRRTEQGPS